VNTAFLLLGSNIEPRLDYLNKAKELLAQGVTIVKSSAVYETEAWKMPAGTTAFLNQVIEIDGTMTVSELLNFTQETERACNRADKSKNTSRTLDIDLLLFNHEIIVSPELQVPHPRLHLRRFTLLPLCEIAGDHIHPQLHQSFHHLLKQCTDICAVRRYDIAL